MIGTGAMGMALLERLKIAGVGDVVCYDVSAPALEGARKLGFSAAASAAEVFKNDRREQTLLSGITCPSAPRDRVHEATNAGAPRPPAC